MRKCVCVSVCGCVFQCFALYTCTVVRIGICVWVCFCMCERLRVRMIIDFALRAVAHPPSSLFANSCDPPRELHTRETCACYTSASVLCCDATLTHTSTEHSSGQQRGWLRFSPTHYAREFTRSVRTVRWIAIKCFHTITRWLNT